MSLRTDITEGIKTAMKAKDKLSLSTLRLVSAAIKDRDIAARATDNPGGIDEAEILSLLAKMVKQRTESANIYDENGRPELAERERGEIEVIKGYMPTPLSDDELEQAVKKAVNDIDATCLKDMGKVMGQLKGKYAGRMDMGKAGAAVKALLMG
ncbi:GatB/YqeY domain-containing protein [bacterium AH-315-J19]|nr:GatB/YqeY domain-containing protein [Robiginitomaculum sp.]MBN4058400.1 GatB/YqeY domain-containing protein [bacterium AH-315-J19]